MNESFVPSKAFVLRPIEEVVNLCKRDGPPHAGRKLIVGAKHQRSTMVDVNR